MIGQLLAGLLGGQSQQQDKYNPFASLMGTLGSGITSGFTGGFIDSIFGKDPAEEAKRMADMLYPGTTPFERLSAGGGGAAGAGSAESVSQKAMQANINLAKRTSDLKAKEIRNQKSIADNNNLTALEVARINAGKVGPAGFNPKAWNNDTGVTNFFDTSDSVNSKSGVTGHFSVDPNKPRKKIKAKTSEPKIIKY